MDIEGIQDERGGNTGIGPVVLRAKDCGSKPWPTPWCVPFACPRHTTVLSLGPHIIPGSLKSRP